MKLLFFLSIGGIDFTFYSNKFDKSRDYLSNYKFKEL